MIPISDDPGPRRRFPFVNYALILINVVVFVLELNYGDCFTADYSTIPAAIVHGAPATIQGCPIGQPSFVGGNMLYLFIFGDNVEDRLGHFWYLVFYLFCGLVASLAQIAVDPTSTQLNLGASGAIAGVLGAYLVFYPGAQVRTLIFLGFFVTFARLSAIIVIGLWFVLQLVSGLASLNPGSVSSGGVAYFAHVGGFAAGFVIALLLRPFLKPVSRYPTSYPAWPQHADLRNRTYGGKYDG